MKSFKSRRALPSVRSLSKGDRIGNLKALDVMAQSLFLLPEQHILSIQSRQVHAHAGTRLLFYKGPNRLFILHWVGKIGKISGR